MEDPDIETLDCTQSTATDAEYLSSHIDDTDVSQFLYPTEEDYSEIEYDDVDLTPDQIKLIKIWSSTPITKKEFPEADFKHLIETHNNEYVKQYVQLVNIWEKAKEHAFAASNKIGKRNLINYLTSIRKN